MSRNVLTTGFGAPVIGEKVSKEYRDRYARFSTGSHFHFGKDGSIATSTNRIAYAKPTGVVTARGKELNENISNMKTSHFNISLTKENTIFKAPYKESNPVGVERPPPIDGRKLRKENWTLGQHPNFHRTINQSSYLQPPNQNSVEQAKLARYLKAKVGGTNINKGDKQNTRSFSTGRNSYETSNGFALRPPGAVYVDKTKQKDQRKKLSQTNFNMGRTFHGYGTTQKAQFVPMRGATTSLEDRQAMVDKNRKTNFVAEMGDFEKQAKPNDFGGMPEKETHHDRASLEKLKNNLRREHFSIGSTEKIPVLPTSSSKIYGMSANLAQSPQRPSWANLMKKNVLLGRDQPHMLRSEKSDTNRNNFLSMRGSNEKLNAAQESLQIKAKMQSDSVQIAGNSTFYGRTSTGATFVDKSRADPNKNSLDRLQMSFICGSHFSTGKGPLGSLTESRQSFPAKSSFDGPVRPDPNRVKFYKEAHFKTGIPNSKLDSASIMNTSFQSRSPIKVNNSKNNAYNQRTKIHSLNKIGNQSTSFVSDMQIRYNWVQPRDVDPGRLKSMGAFGSK